MKNDVNKLKMNITNALELPLDIALDMPKIIITGDLRVDITNHKGIIEYTKDLIRINTSIGIVRVSGKTLEIKNILMEEIGIVGIIHGVEILG